MPTSTMPHAEALSPQPPQAGGGCEVNYFLPRGYAQQSRNLSLDTNRDAAEPYWAPWRIADSARYQHYVYARAARLAREHACHTLLDVGCGVGEKVRIHLAPIVPEITLLDQPSALALAAQRVPAATRIECDLETPPDSLGRAFDMILCADVLEHLLNPDAVLSLIRRACHPGTIVLLSTPERDRERGRACMASNKPEHVREWAMPEFAAYIRSRGFDILTHRVAPKDNAPVWPMRRAERAFRRGQADRSPMCCQFIIARTAEAHP
jgi:2-polyprenyl-3-methyl-5-hydroxy-6-metoxy-1,4-benzoquinol methylase